MAYIHNGILFGLWRGGSPGCGWGWKEKQIETEREEEDCIGDHTKNHLPKATDWENQRG